MYEQLASESYEPKRSPEGQPIVLRLLMWLIVLIVLGTACYLVYLAINKDVQVSCDNSFAVIEECEQSCDGTCKTSLLLNGEPACYECIEEPEVIIQQQICPSGLADSKNECEQNCAGVCTIETTVDSTDCYLCVLCPEGTFLDQAECEASCSNGCYTAGRKNDIECYGCL